MKLFIQAVRPALGLVVVCTLLLGVVYPFVVTGVAQVLFPKRVNGSLVKVDDKVIGSELLGQHFSEPHYFWGRPSATTPPYNATASGGSNLGMANPVLHEQIATRISELKKHDPKNTKPIPVDLITASASGLDPHISIEAALYQIPRVASARKIEQEELSLLVRLYEQQGFWVLFGTPYVNVLELNLALDNLKPLPLKKQTKEKR